MTPLSLVLLAFACRPWRLRSVSWDLQVSARLRNILNIPERIFPRPVSLTAYPTVHVPLGADFSNRALPASDSPRRLSSERN